jgi:hypothetical protein
MRNEFLMDAGKHPLQLCLFPDEVLRIQCSGITTFSNDVDRFMHETDHLDGTLICDKGIAEEKRPQTLREEPCADV